ncbi:ABC transporter ATP-binding protein [Devosia sp. A8/3-2]|nr:ABC transporter ATP-binding protein [Devosia sp. A8/3-2]
MGYMTTIVLDNLTKRFGDNLAVNGVSFTLGTGSFTALLGPSGCSKTTLLRLMAGFEQPSAGTVHFNGRPVGSPDAMVPPERRSTGVVFQSYALWPHMDVAANVAYPLQARGPGRAAIDKRVGKALEMVSLTGFEQRSVDGLSGGQRQRVALARCPVTGTDIILLDEPLANLDVHLRAEMLDVFARLHEETGATIVFVTHDQSEALALADRVIVLDHGVVQQSGRPEQLYNEPANAMVAGFVGRGMFVSALVSEGRVVLADLPVPARGHAHGTKATVLLRPENLALTDVGVPAVVVATRYSGASYDTTLRLANGETVLLTAQERLEPGRPVHFTVEDASDRAGLIRAGAAHPPEGDWPADRVAPAAL